MKTIARLMYTMTEEINSNHIAKVEGSGMPVTCGTCHRGQKYPSVFVPPPPPPEGNRPPGAPGAAPAGAAAPAPHPGN
jgi:hypothetical protein